MIVVMLISLLITGFAGLKTLGSEGKGPLADAGGALVRMAYADRDEHDDHALHKAEGRQQPRKDEYWEDVHEFMTNIMIFLMVLHVGGVVISSWVHRENLILGMITGRKKKA